MNLREHDKANAHLRASKREENWGITVFNSLHGVKGSL